MAPMPMRTSPVSCVVVPRSTCLKLFLSVDKDVSIDTFTNNLLFYSRYIRVTSSVHEDWYYKNPLELWEGQETRRMFIESFNL